MSIIINQKPDNDSPKKESSNGKKEKKQGQDMTGVSVSAVTKKTTTTPTTRNMTQPTTIVQKSKLVSNHIAFWSEQRGKKDSLSIIVKKIIKKLNIYTLVFGPSKKTPYFSFQIPCQHKLPLKLEIGCGYSCWSFIS